VLKHSDGLFKSSRYDNIPGKEGYMFTQLFQALLCLLPVILLLLFLRQAWSLSADAFRWGVTVFKFEESFPVDIPAQLINQTVTLNGIAFKFISQKTCFFRSTRAIKRRPPYLLLLGEINMDNSGNAKIILRIPFSIFFIIISLIIATMGGFILDTNINLIPSLYQLGIGLVSACIFFILFLLIGKESAHTALTIIKEYIIDNSEGNLL
jgi:hypothetical protein